MRWVERHESVLIFCDLLPHLFTFLRDFEGEAKAAVQAASLSHAMQSPAFVVGLAVAESLLGITLLLSRRLQDPKSHDGESLKQVRDTIEHLQDFRQDSTEKFTELYERATSFADAVGGEIVMPRVAGRQTQRQNVEASNPQEYYRRTVFYPFIDHFLQQLKSRFSDSSPLLAVQELLPQFARDGTMERLTPVLKLYERDLAGPTEVIKQEVKIWLWELSKDDEEIQAISFAGCINLAKTLSLPHVVTLLRLYATLPSSTVSA